MSAMRRVLIVPLLLSACVGPQVIDPSPSPTEVARPAVTATATTLVTPSPTAAAMPSVSSSRTPAPATATPPRTPAPSTASAAPSVPVGEAYCTVADVLTPNRAYAEHPRTYLDWTYALPQSYVPPDLVDAVSGVDAAPSPFAVEAVGAAEVMARRGDPAYATLLADAKGSAIRRGAYTDLVAMRAAASQAGVPLVLLSTYRSYALQEITFDYWVKVGGYAQALRTSARPGHSEHQLGTVIDFGDGSAAPWEYADWATTPTGDWLKQHAAEYGFVMSFPKGATPVTCYDYEPWHYRWVGHDVAAQIVAASQPLRVFQAGLR